MTITAQAAIIIPHYNDTKRLARCLRELMPQVTPEVELIVVDNASTDELGDITKSWPDLTIGREPRPGAAEARNRGVLETSAPYLFFIDADCVPASDWVETALRIRDSADVVGGSVDVFDETSGPRTGAQAFETIFAFNNRAYIEQKGFSGTGNLVTRRDVFEDVGPFRAGKSEDLDWSHRATAKGHSLVYCDDLKVSHPTRNDWQALRRKWRRITDESFGLIEPGASGRVKWGARAFAVWLSILPHAVTVMRTDRLSSMGERVRALGTLTRLRLLRGVWMIDQAISGRR